MSLLVDSDVVINILRGRRGEAVTLAGLLAAGEAVCFSPITRAEVFAGMRPNEEASTRKLFHLMQCRDVSDAVGEIAEDVRIFVETRGSPQVVVYATRA